METIGFDFSDVQSIAGVDEVGRGPLVGDVVAAAVILDPHNPIDGLMDSKKLSEKRREQLAVEIKEKALAWSIAVATPAEIDQLNILHATMLAMRRAVLGLKAKPDFVYVDGNRCPEIPYPVEAVVKGDSKVAEISAASIIAKVHRDHQMIELDARFPQYQFAKHKGYPTADHLRLLEEHGVLPEYRRSFGPVKRLVELS
ncbi:ribonuclease HII [Marinobacterium sp. LSUCC0821]|jgi:ribonuclease HII|uniref:ribonuclease HII n=1 Tax=Marinobacterium sp. LSUCC0821 TaxID=2668067 RepID=UPI001451A9E6|nr:ribonuclease HII [Marinobacterium sp. LSUCC0821]QJD72233.1 ribonuclease HII [Marinobacterium sp. LSUCC0821]